MTAAKHIRLSRQEARIMRMVKTWGTGVAALAFSAALAGCISFGPETPPSLLTLTPTAVSPAGPGPSGAMGSAIGIAEPDAPARLAVTRVPVQIDDANVAYLKDAVWVERPTRLFRRLLGETIRVRSNRIVVDSEETSVAPASLLRGTLQDFGYDARSQSVIVRFDAVRTTSGAVVETRRFESIVPGIAAEAGPVSDALNRAANDVAGQVADWVS